VLYRGHLGGLGHGSPSVESFQSVVTNCQSGAAAGWNGETVSDRGVSGDEALQASRRSKSLHRSLPFSKRQVAILSAIIHPFVRPVLEPGCDLSFCGSIRTQFVRDDPFRQAMALDQPNQQPLSCLLIAP